MIKIAPSILSANFASLGAELRSLELAGADLIHIDVMDGHFVPNITIGPCVIKSLRPYTKLPFDVHLMISEPKRYIEEFIKVGADIITIHYEAIDNTQLGQLLQLIKSKGLKCGLSIMPGTGIENIKSFISQLDVILVMTVEPGFGGQTFLTSQLPKIKYLAEEIKALGSRCLLSVDGGINDLTALECKKAGADILVSGSFIFKEDYAKQIAKLKSC